MNFFLWLQSRFLTIISVSSFWFDVDLKIAKLNTLIMIGWSTDCLRFNSVMSGNCSELTALGFDRSCWQIKCLQSWLQKPQCKFLIFIKWDLHIILWNLKVRLAKVTKSIGDDEIIVRVVCFLLSVNMLKCHKRPYDKITWIQQFLFCFRLARQMPKNISVSRWNWNVFTDE